MSVRVVARHLRAFHFGSEVVVVFESSLRRWLVLGSLAASGCNALAFATVRITVQGLAQTRVAAVAPSAVIVQLRLSPRGSIAPDAGEDSYVVREARWDGTSPFSFDVLVTPGAWHAARIDVQVQTVCGADTVTASAATGDLPDVVATGSLEASNMYPVTVTVADVRDFAPCR